MKHSPWKVVLASLALVGSLALSAQADPRPKLSTAQQIFGSADKRKLPAIPAKTSFHRILFPDSTHSIDDGHADDAIGLTGGGDIICLNEFALAGYYPFIFDVSMAWGSPNFPDPTLNGLTYTAVVWSDPSGHGDPSQAKVLVTAPCTISQAGTDTFLGISACIFTSIPTANFFVGFIIHHNAGQAPAAIDEALPVYSGRSYVAGGAVGNIENLNDNDLPVGTAESYGLVGNWLIRADAYPPPPAGTSGDALWYNGDENGVTLTYNEANTSIGAGEYESVYDDFNVTDPAGWDVTSVFSNNFIRYTCVLGATWEIRQGISAGNGGTLIASGMTMTPIVTSTGRIDDPEEYSVQVSGIFAHLPQGNNYFLNVTPIGNLYGRSLISSTSGANAVGQPPGNDQNAFVNSNAFQEYFVSISGDYSMGVNGMVAGEGDLSLVSSASRLTQGASGNFDIPLPGIEGRDAPARSVIVFTFNHEIASSASATASCGMVQSVTIDPNDPKSLLVSMTALTCDQQTVTVTINGIVDTSGDTLASASTSVSFLFGDVNGDGRVSHRDLKQIHGTFDQKADSSNFRSDLNADGVIDRHDIALLRTFRGDSLP